MMKVEFKRVPALDKCFSILELLSKGKKPLGISEISKALNFNKSTVFNIVYTLMDLGVLEDGDNKFRFGTTLYVLGNAAGETSELIHTVHPYLEEISQKTNLTAFLGMRSGHKAIILDKSDSALALRISSAIGLKIPLLAGAHGKVFLSQLPDEKINKILQQSGLKRFTSHSCVSIEKYKEMVKKARKDGIAIDKEEYVEGIRALAVPINTNRKDLQIAIWAVGLKGQLKDGVIPSYSTILKDIAKKIENQLPF